MRTLKLTVAYDGTAYKGWQLQPNGVTVQKVVEDAIAEIMGPHRTLVAGRTDAGVHALGQVVTLRTGKSMESADLLRAMNAKLPGDVGVTSIVEVPNEFDPQRHAKSKLYRYRVHDHVVKPVHARNHVWHVWNVDWDKVAEAAKVLVGEHDFSSFRAQDCAARSAIRRITRLEVLKDPPAGPPEKWIEVEGSGFLKHMVRNLVGSLVEVGRGFHPVEWIREVLDAKDRRVAGRTAPACGLVLVRVDYL